MPEAGQVMEEVLHHLYVGDDQAYDKLKDKPGWSWLRCAKYGAGGHQQTLDYHTLAAPPGPDYLMVRRGHLMALNLLDLDDPNYIDPDMIDSGLSFIGERLKAGDRVLVACNAGHSRGPSVALLYLRSIGEMPYNFGMSVRFFRTLYPHYDPGAGIRQYLRSHWADWERLT